jgi:caffeoyl-CoA O-methyltransferase
LHKEGQLHTIELREEDAATAQLNFSISKNKNQILLHIGNALEIIANLPYTWDLVFIDADKTNYINYYNLVLPKLNNNGLIIADNVLFHGEVVQDEIKGKNAKAIHAFNEYVAQDERTEQIILSVRDGLMMIKKK